MNRKYLYIIGALLLSAGIAYVVIVRIKNSYSQKVQKMQCYCSDLCGPRDVKPDDAPFIDPETGICFCQQRDKDNYLRNSCDTKEMPHFTSYCDTATAK